MDYEVYDTAGNRLYEYDLTQGRLDPYEYTIHHEAVEAVAEQGHWETVVVYTDSQGAEKGRDVRWVVDVAGVEARDAWDDKGINYIYIPLTQAEKDDAEAERKRPSEESRIQSLEETLAAYEDMMLMM